MTRNTRKFRLASLLLLIPTVGVMALPSVASAETKQVLPATICQLHGQALTDNTLAGNESLSYSQHGAVFNNSTTKYLNVVCPIIRHSQNRATIRVYYAAKNPGLPLKCRVHSNSYYGDTAFNSTGWATALGTASPNSGVWWFHTVPQTNNSFGISNYTVFCQIPPTAGNFKSFIGSFIVQD
ncbi:hypothetical protein [Merismopedia glauca]|uniref:Secreted protein n=1 Tax=Merismopedia glauca CCAP 1448/3 TaxID=1296344 RepID=A0A2T1BY87_9CYAN|nr:hypothetical protein [Merismopedia glauca]PSB00971.1 hypothetical protein C7B64_20740 [Merismopedia glauca CCAP 1448/3]